MEMAASGRSGKEQFHGGIVPIGACDGYLIGKVGKLVVQFLFHD